MGSNHVDNSARLCHAASTSAMRVALGYGAATCSYVDWLNADLIVLFGSNVPNNQPVTTSYLHHAKQNGAQIAIVNPYREPGLVRHWIPSIARSACRGPHWRTTGSTSTPAVILLCWGVRALIERGGVDEAFVRDRTTDFDLARRCRGRKLDGHRGGERHDAQAHRRVRAAADGSAQRRLRVVDGAHAARKRRRDNQGAHERRPRTGLPGRANRGLVPIRGHSGVQGGAEVGCIPKVDSATAARWASLWGFPVPQTPGWTAPEMVEHSARGEVDLFWMVGGNFLETLADADRSRAALRRPRLRIHQDVVLSSSMLVDGDGDVLVLPATTRYESPGGGCETSTERRIIFSPEIPGRRIGSARPEWWVFREVKTRIDPERANLVGMSDAAAIGARSPGRSRCMPASKPCPARAIRCSGAAGRSTRTGVSPPGRTGALCGRAAQPSRARQRPFWCQPGAASSSTR